MCSRPPTLGTITMPTATLVPICARIPPIEIPEILVYTCLQLLPGLPMPIEYRRRFARAPWFPSRELLPKAARQLFESCLLDSRVQIIHLSFRLALLHSSSARSCSSWNLQKISHLLYNRCVIRQFASVNGCLRRYGCRPLRLPKQQLSESHDPSR
jgi:hypothetical protein